MSKTLVTYVVNTFCKAYHWEGKKVYIFATSSGSGIGKTAEKLQPYVSGADIVDARLVSIASENRKLFAGVDMRIPMDISVVRIRNKQGKIEEHITTVGERELFRKEYAKSSNVKIIETRKPAPDTDWIDEIEFFDTIFGDR